ncbi:AKH_1a_G0042850.mRNA.1.CDS.1 [Saccharomyces cerevisiae]|nr:AKH_1a_G0042850.mRNA.1.CDS.1 [Saccharomyces cerevisiae]CAI6847925.1 AKH_1a_G0042850.mRNA.1.CDS.1 [Saccharomyces cerevisiae]
MFGSFCYFIAVVPALSFSSDVTFPDFDVDNCTIESLSSWFTMVLTNPDYYGFWVKLIRISAYKWYETSKDYPEIHDINYYRQLLDSIKAIGTYAVLYQCCREDSSLDNIFLTNKYRSWNWIREIYQKVCLEYKKKTPYNIKSYPPESILISGKKLSRSYIKEFYNDVKSRFDDHFTYLGNVYYDNMISVEYAAQVCLDSDLATVEESRVRPRMSFFSLFSDTLRKRVYPIRKPNVVVDKDDVIKRITDMSVCIMWMIYFSGGGPYRFPDILILKYSGNQKNIFVDPVTRCIEILTDYSKNRQVNPTIKTLDKVTSNYLFYFIIAMKTLLRAQLGFNYDKVSRDIFGEMVGDEKTFAMNLTRMDGNIEDPKIYSQEVLQSFLFLNGGTGNLINYDRFSRFLKYYPSSIRENQHLTFREMRRGIIGLTVEYVKLSAASIELINAKERLAGNLPSIGLNSSKTLAQMSSIEIEYSPIITTELQKWLSLGYETNMEKEITKKKKKQFSFAGSLQDLVIAGRKVFGENFEFKDGQERIVMDILLSNNQLIPIQAPPGYGKTTLFQLPLIALPSNKQSVVSFIFVPYVILQENMIFKFESHCNVGNVKDLLKPNIAEEEVVHDVYIGTFNDLGNPIFIDLINNWYEDFSELILGMIVIDEFHNLQTEMSYRGNMFKNINFLNFWKVVVTTGTAGKNLMDAALKQIGYDCVLTKNFKVLKKFVFYHDLVIDIPLKNIIKHFIEFNNINDIYQLVYEYINKILNHDSTSKIIIVCKHKSAVHHISSFHNDILWMDGDLDTSTKSKTARTFIESPDHRVLVGTKLVSEGIDISSVKVVLMVNYLPSIGTYIQTAGRLRTGGLCVSLWTKSCREDDSISTNVCINKQNAKFYSVPHKGHEGCCDKYNDNPSFGFYNYLVNNGEIRNDGDAGFDDSGFDDAGLNSVGDDSGFDDASLNSVGNDSIDNSVNNTFDNDLEGSTEINESSEIDPILNIQNILNERRMMVQSNSCNIRKKRKVDTLKEKINRLYGGHQSFFHFLGVQKKNIFYVCFDGLNETFFDFPLSTAFPGCYKCGGGVNEACVCWDNSKQVSVKTIGMECLLFLKLSLNEHDFQSNVVNVCKNFGLHQVMLTAAANKESHLESFKICVKNYCQFMASGSIYNFTIYGDQFIKKNV